MKTILAPVDFSAASRAVLATAAVLARAMRRRIVLLHVVQPPLITSDYSPTLENVTDIMAASEKAAARQLGRLQKKLHAAKIPVDSRQCTGAPVPQILDQAAKLRSEYIVLGSHGHTALYDLVVGSTTHGVLMN